MLQGREILRGCTQDAKTEKSHHFHARTAIGEALADHGVIVALPFSNQRGESVVLLADGRGSRPGWVMTRRKLYGVRISDQPTDFADGDAWDDEQEPGGPNAEPARARAAGRDRGAAGTSRLPDRRDRPVLPVRRFHADHAQLVREHGLVRPRRSRGLPREQLGRRPQLHPAQWSRPGEHARRSPVRGRYAGFGPHP